MSEKIYPKSCRLFYCGIEECKPGHFFGPTIRYHYLLHYVVSGKGRYEVNGKKYSISEGEIFLIHPNELSFYKADSNEPWTHMWVAFEGYEVIEILNNCNINYTRKVTNKEPFIKDMQSLINTYFCENYNEYKMLGLFYKMMSHLVEKKPNIKSGSDKIYFDTADKYITNNYSSDITVEDISSHVGIERSYLYKIFIKNCGISPKKYILNIRIKSAVNMLSDKNIAISEIAINCGFNDTASFCKQFKKVYGISPSVYRKQLEEYI